MTFLTTFKRKLCRPSKATTKPGSGHRRCFYFNGSTFIMEGKIKYEYSAKMWKHNSPGGWHFVSVPKSISKEIRENLSWQEEGWGRMKAVAQIEDLAWDTAIWFDTKMATYILPIKAKIRTAKNLKVDQEIKMSLWI